MRCAESALPVARSAFRPRRRWTHYSRRQIIAAFSATKLRSSVTIVDPGGRGLQKIQCIAECGWVISRFHLLSRYSGQITWKGRCYLDSALCVGEGGAACVSAISVPPVPCPDRNESHGNTTVRSGACGPSAPVVPPFLCTTRRLIGNNVAGSSFSAATDLEWPRCGSEDSKSEFTQLFGL